MHCNPIAAVLLLFAAISASPTPRLSEDPQPLQMPPKVTIDVSPRTSQVGDSITVSWRASGADSIYISHIGYVPAVGTRRVVPRESTTFYALAEHDGRAVIASAKATVGGSRGGSEFPGRDEPFGNPLKVTCRARSLRGLLKGVTVTLQDGYSMSLDEYPASRNSEYVIITTRREWPGLLVPPDPNIRARRLAFRIRALTTPTPEREYVFVIETLIERNKKLVRGWKQENNPVIAMREALRLRDRIGAGS